MKKRALWKDVLREIRKSFSRFFSIFAIVAIGVAFFAGVRVSAPVMKNTADHYYDTYNLMDLTIMSTIGMTSEDVDAIRELDGIEGVYGSHSIDVLYTDHNQQQVYKLMSYPMNAKQTDKDYINQLHVVEGRLPQNENECVVEYSNLNGTDTRLGKTITFTSGNDDKLEKSLKNTEYKVVGIVTTPYYLSYELGSSTIGNGTVDHYAMIPDTNFTSDYFTEVYVTMNGAKVPNSYTDAYFDIIDPKTTEITALGEDRAAMRFDEIKQDALKKVEDGRKEYEANKAKFETEIKNGKQKLEDAKEELILGQANLQTESSIAESTVQQKEQELQQTEKLLTQLENKYDEIRTYYDTQQQKWNAESDKLQKQINEAKANLSKLDEQIAEVEQQLQNPDLTELERKLLEEKKKTLETTREYAEPTLSMLEQQMSAMEETLNVTKAQMDEISAQIETAQQQVETGKQQLSDAKKALTVQSESAQQQIVSGKAEIKAGEEEIAKQEKDGYAKLQEAKEELDRAEEDIHKMETPSWYVLDRNSHYSYMDYGSAADRMSAIAKIFPVFFFLVAALVCLTTMTRMVDEQRQEIGTLKALGYSKMDIALKYIVYAAIASIFGGIAGAVLGMSIFPAVIFNAWNIMYTLPKVQLYADIGLAAFAIALVSCITVLSAFAAVYKELIETPALLMRPKAPKNGKKILLERIPFIWKRFSFIYKVTARNIFRYKKRFLMTVIGISGCTALLLAGFGIRDSISEIAVRQYGELFKFDMSMSYSKGASVSEKEEDLNALKKESGVENATSMALYHGFYDEDGEDKGIDLYVPTDVKNFPDFVSLIDPDSEEEVKLSDEGAVISEKLAKDKGLKEGDTLEIDNGDGVKKEVKIAGITENYVGHVLYMTPAYYKSVYHKTPQDTTMFALLKNSADSQELANKFMQKETIDSVSIYSDLADTFENMISSLNIVVVVLTVSAGLLAFVVLYNLTNVNISERLREIATIKVLGFYDKEVNAYVYRENIFLTLIGSLTGLLLGIVLHHLIMSLAELDTVMFGRNIEPFSFIISVVITMLFAVIVNLVMYRKLKNIPMVESLKSVE